MNNDSAMPWSALAALLLTILFWGSSFLGIKIGLEAFGPGELACLRFGVASLVLGLFALVRPIPVPELRDVPALFALGLAGITTYHLCLNWGQRTVAPGTTALIIQTSPVFTALITHQLKMERLNRQSVLGIAIAFGGTVVLIAGQGRDVEFTVSALAIVVSALVTSIYFVMQKPFLTKYGVRATTTWTIVMGTLPFLFWLPSAMRQLSVAPSLNVGAVVYIGIFPAAIAYTLWNYAISRIGPTRASVFLYLSPVIAMGTTWLFYGTVPGWLTLAGGAVALVGVYIVNAARARKR
jgi:drug/metabolite transporter (DMT)-like permease